MDFSDSPTTACLLVDNGSLVPAATLGLRRIAGALSTRVGRVVEPVSLLHSSTIPAEKLGGVPAEILEPALRARHGAGLSRFLIVPLFFGPSGALTEYIPRRIAALAGELPGLEVRMAAPLMEVNNARDHRVATIVADQARAVIDRERLQRPVVVLVDHGSPQRAVTAARDQIARQLAQELGSAVRAVVAASMERRAGAEFDFTEPLLERALAAPPCGVGQASAPARIETTVNHVGSREQPLTRDGAGEVVVAPLFFLPGRHAGPGGDIEKICRAAEARQRGLRVHLAGLVGEHPRLIELLADRYRDAMAASV